MTTKTLGPVLLLGADPYVLRACESNEIEAIMLYGSALKDLGLPAIPKCVTPIFAENHRNPESILAALQRNGLQDLRPAAVHTTGEYSLVAAAVLSRVFDCPGMRPETAVRFRDKAVQKDVVRRAGIPVAQVQVIDDIHFLDEDLSLRHDRSVVKPIAGGASRLTTAVGSMEELDAISRRYRAQGTSARTFVLEEFIQGEEWFVDGIVFNGKVVFWSLGAYGNPLLFAVTNQIPPVMRRLDPNKDSWQHALAEPVIIDSLKALGLLNGVFHLELFFNPDSGVVLFSECAARRGGGLVQEDVHCKFNVDLAEAALMCALERDINLNVHIRSGVVGSTYTMTSSGTIMRYPLAKEVMARPGVEFVSFELPFGFSMAGNPDDTATRVASVMLLAASKDEFDRRSKELHTWFQQRLVAAPHQTSMRELKEWQRKNWPERAFEEVLYSPFRSIITFPMHP